MYNVATDLWGDIMYEDDTGDTHWFKKSQIDELENILQSQNSFEILKHWDKLEFYSRLKKEL